GRGIASALMEAVLRLAREDAGTHTVVSVIAGGNAASVRLHEKFGFTCSGTLHEVGLKFGRYLDIVNYELRVG
ncbi:MAG: GNAT family N-acetyltransferase, partial [Oscillibacter sp.]|nr:GNAT family N-acetyltransferase [Oscillibacter sp.]MDY5711709.1 GNAT family N-acetyltransferase [Oscillospiraceae bacterium]